MPAGENDGAPKRASKTVVGIAPFIPAAKQGQRSPFLVVIAGEHAGMTLRVPATGSLLIGRDPSADLTLGDALCSRRHAHVFRSGGTTVLEDLGSTNRTLLNGIALDGPALLQDGDRIAIGGSLMRFSLQDEVEETFQSSLYRSATRDPLTGVYNKRYFLESLDRAVRHHARHQTPLSLLLYDLDHFKDVNDTRGHLAGDEVLKALATTVTRNLRAENLFCRIGGEEFAIILADASLEEAARLAERLRSEIEATDIPFESAIIKVTASFGVAALTPSNADPNALIAAADDVLYDAKRDGRNRVAVQRLPRNDEPTIAQPT